MRWCALILLCTLLVTTCADPEPKKYKSEIKDKDKQSNTTLTTDEKKFLRDVEAKYGIKSDTAIDNKKNDTKEEAETSKSGQEPFPAVIAIEIVNDTDSKSKGKRTIDANLGYGYKTNAGYTYSYFGKPAQEKGKFTIYPYSQEDIPAENQASNQNTYQQFHHYDKSTGKHIKTSVEIQPSQAFELVPVKNEKTGYNYRKPSVEFNTPSIHSSDQTSSYKTPSTLYTTYNGGHFTGLSGQFPSVMSNYLVDPTQLLKNPEYQNVGLTQDHLRPHGSHLDKKVVPVLVLRIPSSSLTNPSAQLYANLPQNYPLSNYLNNVNLQELVNNYFKKIGYKFAPQVSYTNSISSAPVAGSVSQYEPQHYARPYVQPSYTQSDYSGVQYSAVQPVMARYPSSYVRQHYTLPKGHTLYNYPMQPKYEYQYQYVQQPGTSSQNYYYQPQYHQPEQVTSQEVHSEHSSLSHGTSVHDTNAQVQYGAPSSLSHGTNVHDTNAQVQYEAPAEVTSSHETAVTSSVEYGISHPNAAEYESSVTVSPQYGQIQEEHSQSLPAGYDTKINAYEASRESAGSQDYYQNIPQQETITVIEPRQKYQSHTNVDNTQSYVYQQQGHDNSNDGLVLSENFPSKDHTIATVLPSQYKAGGHISGAVQSVSYVTPMPYSSKYQLPYKVIVPQTFLHNPTTEKVSYVTSHTVAPSYSQTVIRQEYNNPEAEYTVGYHYVPPVSKQKAPSYPRNYHSHPKRMVKTENKQDNVASSLKKQNDQSEKKSS